MTMRSDSLARRSVGRRAALALLCATAMSPLAATTSNEHSHERDTVWVTNRDKETVMVFDAATGDPVTAIPLQVGPGVHDIAFSRRAGKVFISDDSSKVFVLSATTRELLDTIEFDPGSRPHHLSVSHDGKALFVGLFSSNTVAAVDTRTHAAITFPSSNQPGTAHAPEPSPDDRFLFVPHEGQNLVTQVPLHGSRPIKAIAMGAANSSPSEVLPTRDGETLFVAMRVEGTIRTIDVDSFTPIGEPLPVGVQPESLILTPGERTLIVGLRGSPARLAFVDTGTMTLSKTLDLAGAGTFGDLAAASADGRYVYAAFNTLAAGNGGVVKVDAFRRTIVDTFMYPGTGRPHGVAYVRGCGGRH